MKSTLQSCLAEQDVVPLISESVAWDPHDLNNGHNGFMLRHEYEDVGARVHIGNCFDPQALRNALSGKSKVHAYSSLDELLADWRVD